MRERSNTLFIAPVYTFHLTKIHCKQYNLQAETDSSQPRGGPSLSIVGGKIIFEKYIGSEQRPRGRVYGPNDFIPTPREEFWRYTYEVIRL